MASISDDGGGRRRILVVCPDGVRRAIRLGKCTAKQATAFKVKLEQLVTAAVTGTMDDDTARWLAARDDCTHARLAALELTTPRQQFHSKLSKFVDAYIAGRTDIKLNTRIQLTQARAKLVAFFGADKRIADISAGDAEEYWR